MKFEDGSLQATRAAVLQHCLNVSYFMGPYQAGTHGVHHGEDPHLGRTYVERDNHVLKRG